MECHDARLLLTLQRREPEQVDAVEVDALEAHVELCPGCQTWLHSEARFDAAVSAAVKDVAIPAGLKDKILTRVATTRPWTSRLPDRRAWAAIAAAVLLMVGVGSTIAWMQPQPIEVERYSLIAFDNGSSGRPPQEVQDFFADLGYSMTPPSDFQYSLLQDYKLVMFQGRMVPRLTFQCRDRGIFVTAHVYCLPTRQFTYDGRPLQGVSPDRQYHVIQNEHGLYFVDCNGDLWLFRTGAAI